MKGCIKLALLGGVSVGAAGLACYLWNIRMPMKEYLQYALYMAVLDDAICRNALEGNQINGIPITFPQKAESLQYRYHLFLEQNRKKRGEQLKEEIARMEHRLRASQRYACQPKTTLTLEIR